MSRLSPDPLPIKAPDPFLCRERKLLWLSQISRQETNPHRQCQQVLFLWRQQWGQWSDKGNQRFDARQSINTWEKCPPHELFLYKNKMLSPPSLSRPGSNNTASTQPSATTPDTLSKPSNRYSSETSPGRYLETAPGHKSSG